MSQPVVISRHNIKNRYVLLAVCFLAFCAAVGFAGAANPGELLVLASGLSSFLAAIAFGLMLPSAMMDKVDRIIFLGLCNTGIIFNTIVRVVNKGYMPVLDLSRTTGRWISMDGARYNWMGDWLVYGYSIGDILLLMAAFWVFYCIFRWWAKNTGIGKRFWKLTGIQITRSREYRL